MRHFPFRIQRNVNNGPCIWSSLVECMKPVSCSPWTNSAYVCSYYRVVCDWWLYSKLLLVFDIGVVGNFTSCAILLCEYTATLITALHWSSLVKCMERVSSRSWMNSAYVCSCCCVMCDWPYSVQCSMHGVVCNLTSCAILLYEYTTTSSIMTLRWSSFMEWVPCWPWTNREYVCSYYCVICDWS